MCVLSLVNEVTKIMMDDHARGKMGCHFSIITPQKIRSFEYVNV